MRPTTDRTKEMIFNVLGDEVRDALIIDLFAGTGSLGIEALSRGAAKAIFVEKNRRAQAIIQQNLEKTGFTESAELHPLPVERFLKGRVPTADIIFADPPYEEPWAARLLRAIVERQLLAPAGWLVLEHSQGEHVDAPDVDWMVLKSQKRQGETRVSFFQYVEER